jgi:hypothetical protein
MKDYRKRRKRECRKLFAGFSPDVSRCRTPEFVLKVAELAADGHFSEEISEKLGRTPKAIQKIFRRYNFPKLHNFAPPLRSERRGWKGGIKMVKGYGYSRTPGHPHASKHGQYVAIHRLVMEKVLGRYLKKEEVVHHIDGNPLNNLPENLELFENNGAHLAKSLAGKRPNWSEEGLKRIGRPRRHANLAEASSQTQP